MTTAVAAFPTVRKAVPWPRHMRQVVLALAAILLLAWTVFPFVWILLTSLKSPGDILSVPPKFVYWFCIISLYESESRLLPWRSGTLDGPTLKVPIVAFVGPVNVELAVFVQSTWNFQTRMLYEP